VGVKESLLSGLKPALTAQVKAGIDNGQLKQPVDFKVTSDNVWKRCKTNIQTAGAIMAFGIKREDIDRILREVFADLKVEVKDEESTP
jgi:hypothetical protein